MQSALSKRQPGARMKTKAWLPAAKVFSTMLFGALSMACSDSLPTAPISGSRSRPIAVAPNMIAYWTCQETTWLSDGTSVIDCYLDFFDDGLGGSGDPYSDIGSPIDIGAESGGGGSAEAPSDPSEVWSEADLACPPQMCDHWEGVFNSDWEGCPARIFYSDPNGPHGPEVWSLKLGTMPKWAPWLNAMVGYYQGTSTINGYTYHFATAINVCAVGYVNFRSKHP